MKHPSLIILALVAASSGGAFANDIHERSLGTQQQTSFPYILAWVAAGSWVCLLMIFIRVCYARNTKCLLLALQGHRRCKQVFPV